MLAEQILFFQEGIFVCQTDINFLGDVCSVHRTDTNFPGNIIEQIGIFQEGTPSEHIFH